MRKEDCRQLLLNSHGRLLPDPGQFKAYCQCIETPQPSCLRLNPLMPVPAALQTALNRTGRPVHWCPQAIVMPTAEHVLGHTLEYALGAIYIQAAAATLAVTALDPQPGERVLDIAAAPGGKTTQIASAMANTGLLVANEPQPRRLSALVGNLDRCGVSNTVITRSPGTLLAQQFSNYFDRVLLDAPCSGDGILRKTAGMLNYWSPINAKHQAQLQIGLLRAAFHMLKPGGHLVYSTCSLGLEENEDVILGLLRRYSEQVEVLPIDLIEPALLPANLSENYPKSLRHCRRVWPHLHNSEGAFVARIRKTAPTKWPKNTVNSPVCSVTSKKHRAMEKEAIEEYWQFTIPLAAGQLLTVHNRLIQVEPFDAQSLRETYPYFVRAGMRVARQHKNHFYLTQQAVTTWGPRLQHNVVELTWPQVCQLFRGEKVTLSPESTLRGECLCRFGPWTVCRGIISGSREELSSMLPRNYRRADLQRLTSYKSDGNNIPQQE